MFDYPEFNSDGILTLCEIDGKNADMLMTIRVKRFKENETFELIDAECETAFLIQRGCAKITWNSRTEEMKRRDPFEKKPVGGTVQLLRRLGDPKGDGLHGRGYG